jgi:predicted nucleotidyltransferase
VRNEQTPSSDIDILIDFHPEKETFQNYMAVCDMLEDLFKRHKIDIVTVKGLSPYIGQQILSEVEYV